MQDVGKNLPERGPVVDKGEMCERLKLRHWDIDLVILSCWNLRFGMSFGFFRRGTIGPAALSLFLATEGGKCSASAVTFALGAIGSPVALCGIAVNLATSPGGSPENRVASSSTYADIAGRFRAFESSDIVNCDDVADTTVQQCCYCGIEPNSRYLPFTQSVVKWICRG